MPRGAYHHHPKNVLVNGNRMESTCVYGKRGGGESREFSRLRFQRLTLMTSLLRISCIDRFFLRFQSKVVDSDLRAMATFLKLVDI